MCHLEHPSIQIYMIYMFHTTLKEGFATASYTNYPPAMQTEKLPKA